MGNIIQNFVNYIYPPKIDDHFLVTVDRTFKIEPIDDDHYFTPPKKSIYTYELR